MTATQLNWLRVKSDINGNPRFVVGWWQLSNDKIEAEAKKRQDTIKPFKFVSSHQYDIILSLLKKVGGKKYHNKQFGGGIVFSSYNLKDTEKKIFEEINNY